MVNRFARLIERRRKATRWIYIPYAAVLAAALVMGLVMGEPPSSLVTNMIVLLILIVQTIRPTILGWTAIVVSWFCIGFLGLLYARIFMGIWEFNNWVLLLVGLLPLVPLFLLRPRPE